MAQERRRDRRRNSGEFRVKPRPSPVNRLVLLVVGVLAATAAATVLFDGGMSEDTPHGRLLIALRATADAQEAHHREAGSFADRTAELKLTLPTGVRLTVLHADRERWEALAAEREVGLRCVQSGEWAPGGPERDEPTCYLDGG